MSINPLANRPRADACGFGNGLRRLSARDLPYNALSTARRQPGILMHVHPVLPWNLKLQQPQFPRSEPDGQPTESPHLAKWPAPGSEDTELGVLMEQEVGHGATEVYTGVQA